MKYLVVVKADTNDGDYLQKVTEIIPGTQRPPDYYIWFRHITDAIKACKESHNWPVDWKLNEVKELYKGVLNDDDIENFNPLVPKSEDYGCHTIVSVKLHTVIETEDLL